MGKIQITQDEKQVVICVGGARLTITAEGFCYTPAPGEHASAPKFEFTCLREEQANHPEAAEAGDCCKNGFHQD